MGKFGRKGKAKGMAVKGQEPMKVTEAMTAKWMMAGNADSCGGVACAPVTKMTAPPSAPAVGICVGGDKHGEQEPEHDSDPFLHKAPRRISRGTLYLPGYVSTRQTCDRAGFVL